MYHKHKVLNSCDLIPSWMASHDDEGGGKLMSLQVGRTCGKLPWAAFLAPLRVTLRVISKRAGRWARLETWMVKTQLILFPSFDAPNRVSPRDVLRLQAHFGQSFVNDQTDNVDR